MKFAAIDIGSNAIRLLFSNVIESKDTIHFHKASLVRMPVRLGSDSFLRGEISKSKKEDLVKTIDAYSKLIDVYQVEDYMACATSALREATNGPEVVAEVKERTGMDIRLIDGELEAELIYHTHVAENLDKSQAYIYIDVGGGSTELTVFSHGERQAARSFRIGTIRLLENIVSEEEWNSLFEWLSEVAMPHGPLTAIGTGGNINKLFKLSGRKEGTPMYLNTLSHYQKYLNSFTYEERISELGMRPDRADVIIPATQIYYQIMKWAKIHEMIVPKLGLVDGMVRLLYDKYKKKQ